MRPVDSFSTLYLCPISTWLLNDDKRHKEIYLDHSAPLTGMRLFWPNQTAAYRAKMYCVALCLCLWRRIVQAYLFVVFP